MLMDTNGNTKELLIKDLSSRLPYDVKVLYDNKVFSIDYVSSIYEEIKLDTCDNYTLDVSDVKPYLFPLSSITDKQAKEIQEIVGNSDNACIIRKTDGLELWLNSIDTDPTIWLDTIFEVQDYLNKNHFDYRGLIPMGLAIDATGLNIY